MKFNVKIELDKVVLIGNDPNFKINYKSEIETRWLMIKEITNKIFCLKSNEINESSEFVKNLKNSNYQIIDLEKRIRQKANDAIDRELNKIFDENKFKEDMILEYEITEKVDKETGEIIPEKAYKYINDAHLFGIKYRDNEYRTRYLNLGLNSISDGIITVMDTNIKYDLLKDKFLSTDREVLLAFYQPNEIKQIISYEKHQLGIGSDFYSEILKINNFMKNKKTINVVLKNGTEFKTDARLREILNIQCNGEIFISSTYNQKIIEGEKFNDYQYKIDELKCLKYGKNILEIDSDKLLLNDTKEYLEEFEETEEM